MKKCYNMAIYYLLHIMFKYWNENHPYGGLSGFQFDSLSTTDKKNYLKESAEKAIINFDTLLDQQIFSYENGGELTEKQRLDLSRLKQAKNISNSVRVAVDRANNGSREKGKNINCFLHEDEDPSMSYFAPAHGFHCFACGGAKDVIDIFNLIGLKAEWDGKPTMTFGEKMKVAAEWFVDQRESRIENLFSNGNSSSNRDFIKFTPAMNKSRHSTYWNFVDIKNDPKGIEYLESRGIDLQTAIRTGVMVLYPKDINTGKYQGRGYITFFNGNGSYVRRLFIENKEISQYYPLHKSGGKDDGKWWNSNGSTGVFNEQVIAHCAKFSEVCFVCESAIDALSCEVLGYHAIALNGVENAGSFLQKLNEENIVKYICLSDNDEGGWRMASWFKECHFFVSEHWITKEGVFARHKDVNECFVAEPKEVAKALADLESQANEFYKY